MHLKRITLHNLKCFADIELDFSDGNGHIRKWTTIFGKNGLGKSTILRAIGVALAGRAAIRELLPVAEGWVRKGQPYGEIMAELMWTEGDIPPTVAQTSRPKRHTPFITRYLVTGNDPEQLPTLLQNRYSYTVPTIVPWSGDGSPKERGDVTKDLKRLQQTAYAEHKLGWFACGYGAFRRLAGDTPEANRIVQAGRLSARFVTLFREDAALTNANDWLLHLHNTAREGDSASQQTLAQIQQIFTADLFPDVVQLHLSASQVMLEVGQQAPVPLNDLSDGYRSMLALAVDLLRWLMHAFPQAPDITQCPGIVLIDELDAHLHPNWQRHIGHWLRAKFPQIQFIIATHSPFLAQVADNNGVHGQNGTTPLSNIVLEETPLGVQTRPEVKPVHDLRVDQILLTPLFGVDSLLAPDIERKLKRHQQLYQKQLTQPLSDAEAAEYAQLDRWRERLATLTTPEGRQIQHILRQAIDKHRDELFELS